jgi:hypothetical protein
MFRVAARINCRPRQVLPENAVALVLKLENLAINPFQGAHPPWFGLTHVRLGSMM